jgi:hypothetical protein
MTENLSCLLMRKSSGSQGGGAWIPGQAGDDRELVIPADAEVQRFAVRRGMDPRS